MQDPIYPYAFRGRKVGGPKTGPDDPSRKEVDVTFGFLRRPKQHEKISPVGKCDHERVHEDEDGKRCLFCAAWLNV